MAHLIESPGTVCAGGVHMQIPSDEPVFHFAQLDGHHGIAGLALVKSWARSINEEGVPLAQYASDLHVMLPGGTRLIRCTLNVIDCGNGPEMEIEALRATGPISNALYTCKI